MRDDTNLRWNGDVAVVTARKQHPCERCTDPIEKGTRYVFSLERSGGGRYAETERCHYHIDCYPWSEERALLEESE
jgi:hypothetical protein